MEMIYVVYTDNQVYGQFIYEYWKELKCVNQ